MLFTSSEAAKFLRKLNEERQAIESTEQKSSTFPAAINEDVENVRPEYNYAETQKILAELEAKVRKVKHAINKFNLEHEVPGFNMTVDEMLVYIPQLTKKKQKLSSMRDTLPKVRETLRLNGIVDYTYTNYDIEEVKRDYKKVADELSRAQTALDVLNNTVKFEIDV